MYTDKQRLIDTFGLDTLIQLTDRSTPPVHDIDDDVLNKVIVDVDSLIDSQLRGRYTLPLATVPPVLRRYADDITRYYLYQDRATERVTELYNDAMKYLRDVRDGKINLDVPDEAGPADNNVPEFETPGRVFNHTTLQDF